MFDRRIALIALIALAMVPMKAYAGCAHDTTAREPRTLFRGIGVAALHVDQGAGSAPVAGRPEHVMEFKMGIALCRWPSFTLSAVGSESIVLAAPGYVAPGSSTFHPDLFVESNGIELQRRWRDSSIFHPMLSFATGSIHAEYRYSRRDESGVWRSQVDGASTGRYFMPAVGMEASLFKYMTMYGNVGARFTTLTGTPGLDAGALNGAFSVIGFAFGKFR
jgi:hypothetical protein